MDQYKEILITGGAGWLGENLLGFLTRSGYAASVDEIRVFIKDNKEPPDTLEGEKFTLFQGDLRRENDRFCFFESVNSGLLIHLAGVIHPRQTKVFYDVNVESSRELLKLASQSQVERAIVISSSACIGYNSSSTNTFDETADYDPQGHYGRSKMLLERETRAYWSKSTLDTVILRPPWFYGPHGPPRQKQFFELIRKGLVPIVGDGNNRRSMIYVPKLCEAILLASTRRKACNNLYWIADKLPYRYCDIIRTVRELIEKELGINCRKQKFYVPDIIGGFAKFIDDVQQSIGFYSKSIHVFSELNKNIACTVQKAQSDLGYEPVSSLCYGLRDTLKRISLSKE